MDLYRAGEALIRSSQPLLPFLAPAAYKAPRRASAAAPVARHCQRQRHTARSFTTSERRQEEQQRRDSFPSTTPSKPSGVTYDISSMLDSTLDLNKGVPTAPTSRTSRWSSQIAQRHSDASRIIDEELAEARGGNKAGRGVESLLDMFTKTGPLTAPQRQQNSRYASSEISSMLDPFGSSGSMPPAANLDKEPVKLPKNVGRLVEVNEKKNMDVGRAFRTMEIQCARNSVRRDFQKQRFHERPGLKRKRLRRERWAKRFKANFVGTVQMVQRMRRQGW